jgi:PAS domain S-box-containing protein
MEFVSIHETILNSMSEAVYVVDRNMRIQYANPAAEKLTGFSIDESIGKYCHHIFCEQSFRCEEICPPKKAMTEQMPILHREAETRHKNGQVHQTQISISPYFDNEQCVGAVVVMKDITELRKAEDLINRQNTFLTAIIDALPHPFYVIDAGTYELKLANYAAYQGKLLEKTTCYTLSHGLDKPCSGADHPCLLEKVKETGQPVILEHTHRDRDNASKDFEVHGYPIFDETGNLAQVIEYCVDISERKRAAQERETLITDLQRALQEVRTLSGMLPICSSCKKIRDDKGYWNNLEMYISEHSEAEFSHGLCPDCAQRLYPKYFPKGPQDKESTG